MAGRKLISINDRKLTRERLVLAVGTVLARRGYAGITPDEVCREAGVDRRALFSRYKGLEGLVRAYGESGLFWPTAGELAAGEEERLSAMAPGDLMAEYFIRLLRNVRARPETLRILAFESMERTRLTTILEQVRVRTALEFFELMRDDPPPELDLTALVLLVSGSMYFLLTRQRLHRSLGGVDLHSERGQRRVEETLRRLLRRTLGSVFLGAGDTGPKKGEGGTAAPAE